MKELKRGNKAVPELKHLEEIYPLEEIERLLSPATRELIENKHNPGLVKTLNLKLNNKGYVELYGIGQNAVRFYKEQWIKLYHAMPQIITFIKLNDPYIPLKKPLQYDIPEVTDEKKV